MALHISLSSPISFIGSSTSLNKDLGFADGYSHSRTGLISWKKKTKKKGCGWGPVAVRSSLDTVEPRLGQVTAVNKDTFWPIVKAAEPNIVVLDMYTQWCGPCKVMAPKFQELSEKYLDVVFLKLDCNQENKPLAKELGMKVVPTFKILKDSKVVKEVRGAKLNDLVSAIDTVKSSQ